MIRAFIALPLPPETRAALARLAEGVPGGRAADPDNLHVTLAFLDSQPEPLLEEIHYALEALAEPELSLQIRGLGAFGKAPPRLVYAAVAPDPALTRLRRKVRQLVRDAGLELPHERFVPHVTLARFPARLDPEKAARLDAFLARNAGLAIAGIPIREMALYRSTLRPEGALHDVLASYPLGA